VDLSFTFSDPPAGIMPIASHGSAPGASTPLLLDAAVRQGSSATAMIQAGMEMAAVAGAAAGPFAPAHGSFNARVAARMVRWRQR
jgi:hypothetical protein